FEMIPPEGSFSVMMRKREQQRKQRKLFVWLSMSAVVAMVMSVGLWFAVKDGQSVSMNKQEDIHQQKPLAGMNTREKLPVQVSESSKTDDDYKQQTFSTPINTQPTSKIYAEKTRLSPRPDVVSVKPASNIHLPTSTFQPLSEAESKEYIETIHSATSPKEVASPATTIAVTHSDSILTSTQPVADSLQAKAAVDSSMQTTGDPSMETLSVPSPAKQSYWSIAAVFTPQLMNSVYNANSDASLSWMQKYLKNREQNDKAQYSFNAGIKVEKHFGKHWDVSAGVLYSKVQFEEIKIVNHIIIDSTKNQLSVAAAYRENRVEEVEQNRFDISLSSLEFPVQVGY
ncbi:MAG: hypothetical protein V4651_05760, partial [Bacteroidota bacterium]